MSRNAATKRAFQTRLRRVATELRWRGLLRFAMLVMREILSPLLYWHVLYVFEKDVEPTTHEANSELKVKLYSGLGHLDRLERDLPPMGEIGTAVIESRLAAGDVVAVAYAGNAPVGYAWMTFSSGLEVAFDTVWVLGATEAAFHGSFTHPAWRGRGIQRELDAALMRYAYQNGVAKIFLTISALNAASLRAAKHMHKQRPMTLILARVKGLNLVFRKSIGAPMESRFAVNLHAENIRPVPKELRDRVTPERRQ